MIKLINQPVSFRNGTLSVGNGDKKGTMAYSILSAHNVGSDSEHLKIKFDAMASHDITYVGIIQTVRAGLERFPIPYVLTNCHNSLCAVGGTINEDDHVFGLSAAKKYGGIFVPPHLAVIHQYMREMFAAPGRMLIGSDSHTRYGALGALSIGEGGPELAKQLVGKTYDIDMPDVVAVYLTGSPKKGVGPQDVALAIIGAVYKNDFVKNKVMEFFGPGLASLSADYRLGIDVMTTETACLSSVWATDGAVKDYLTVHGRGDQYAEQSPAEGAEYACAIEVDLSKVEPMIALPFHPSNTYTLRELLENPEDILRKAEVDALNLGMKGLDLVSKVKNGKIYVDQGVIAGCAGGIFENLTAAADILDSASTGCDAFSLSVYPASQPVYMELLANGAAAKLAAAGAVIKTAFCGPCFGAGDVPCNNGLSIRHSTRNFENREGSKPANGQCAAVALMDARSIAATAANGGCLTAATDLDVDYTAHSYSFNGGIYQKRVYNGYSKPDASAELHFAPSIVDWPVMPELKNSLALRVAAYITDPVTTTDELIPSGETSSYRSNPLYLAEFALSRKDPAYVGRAKAIAKEGSESIKAELELCGVKSEDTLLKSAVCAFNPGDGSAREQAASCQRVLGGGANLTVRYATKRYRSNLINWGMLPLRFKNPDDMKSVSVGSLIVLPEVRSVIENGGSDVSGFIVENGVKTPIEFTLDKLTDEERRIILSGSLANYCTK